MKKFLSTVFILGITLSMMANANSQIAEPMPEKPNIIETERIEPDVVTLAENEVRFTSGWGEGCTDNTLEISYQDAQLLMQVASAEALNQGTEGMIRVMQVILNRVESDDWPDTVQEVVYQSGQFESVTSGAIYKAQITPEVRMALVEIEKNLNKDNQIIAFETSANGKSLLRYFDYSYTEGTHDFYKKKKN